MIARPSSSVKEIEEMAANVRNDVATATEKRLENFAHLHQARADRLSKVRQRLEASLGRDHARVKALEFSIRVAKARHEALRKSAARQAKRPKIGPHEWMVFGRVRSPQGQPVKALRIRVFDKDRKLDDLLGDTATDEFGEFAVVYHERDFAEVREGLPELYVLVEDQAGKQLFSSRDKIRVQAGRADYFDITLPEEESTESPATKERPSSPPPGRKRKESKMGPSGASRKGPAPDREGKTEG